MNVLNLLFCGVLIAVVIILAYLVSSFNDNEEGDSYVYNGQDDLSTGTFAD